METLLCFTGSGHDHHGARQDFLAKFARFLDESCELRFRAPFGDPRFTFPGAKRKESIRVLKIFSPLYLAGIILDPEQASPAGLFAPRPAAA